MDNLSNLKVLFGLFAKENFHYKSEALNIGNGSDTKSTHDMIYTMDPACVHA